MRCYQPVQKGSSQGLRQFNFGSNSQLQRCRSSEVEHSLGKGEVESSILSGSTIYITQFCPSILGCLKRTRRIPPRHCLNLQ